MQIPILNGIYTNHDASDFRTSYPKNLVPVPKSQGISNGYLRPADGIVQLGTSTGTDRGGINWNDACYRVMGTKLVLISSTGVSTTLGDVGTGGQVTLDYSFDYLAVASNRNLFLYDGTTLTQVTDIDLGNCIDFIWIDGFFLSTDGENIISSQANDPFSYNPDKYEGSILDPDPILGIKKLRNEAVVINRHTIEFFDNVGGSGFPFARIDGAQLQRGCVGTHASAIFAEHIAFLGGGRNEAPAIWMGANGQTAKLSTREIDQIIATYPESTLQNVVMHARVDSNHNHLWVQFPDRTLIYDANASSAIEEPVWFELTSGLLSTGQYRATNPVWCYEKWVVGDPQSYNGGELVNTRSDHWGEKNGWEFQTTIIYNESRKAIFHSLELVALTGRTTVLVDSPVVWTSYSLDGMQFSQEKSVITGTQGEYDKRMRWFQQGFMRNWRIQKFRGTSDSHLTVARLEAQLEPLNV